jgi:hypothetical protein
MSRKELLQLRVIMGRVDLEEASAMLNFRPYETALLIRLGHLKCLGVPKQNSRRWLAASHVLEVATDPKALDRCTRAVARHFEEKSRKQRTRKAVTEVDFVDGERTENA